MADGTTPTFLERPDGEFGTALRVAGVHARERPDPGGVGRVVVTRLLCERHRPPVVDPHPYAVDERSPDSLKAVSFVTHGPSSGSKRGARLAALDAHASAPKVAQAGICHLPRSQ